MKRLIPILILATTLAFQSCNTFHAMNYEVKKENGEKYLYGGFTRDKLSEKPYNEWYQSEYESYKPDSILLKTIKKDLQKYKIEIFMGTWCSDSQREVPRMLKILDEVKFPEVRLHLIAVNEAKKSFYGDEINKNISHVPTFIFYHEGKEVGRIVESPVNSKLEQDLVQIIQSPKTYKPNYAEE